MIPLSGITPITPKIYLLTKRKKTIIINEKKVQRKQNRNHVIETNRMNEWKLKKRSTKIYPNFIRHMEIIRHNDELNTKLSNYQWKKKQKQKLNTNKNIFKLSVKNRSSNRGIREKPISLIISIAAHKMYWFGCLFFSSSNLDSNTRCVGAPPPAHIYNTFITFEYVFYGVVHCTLLSRIFKHDTNENDALNVCMCVFFVCE